MRRRGRLEGWGDFCSLFTFVLIFLFLLPGRELSAAIFSDDLGRKIEVEGSPQRIVSVAPSVTETLFALGLGDRVVGVSSSRSLEENRELIAKADLVVVERFHVGKGNLANLQAALEALEKGKRVIVLENNLEFDFTEGEAKAYFQRLKERGAEFIPDHCHLLEQVERTLC